MDIDDFRSILESSGVDVWSFIETAIQVASLDFGAELKRRRDKIVETLYAKSSPCSQCRNRDFDDDVANRHRSSSKMTTTTNNNNNNNNNGDVDDDDEEEEEQFEGGKGGGGGGDDGGGCGGSPLTPPRTIHMDGDDDELDPYGGLFDDEQKKILEIKQHLEDPDQSEDSLVDLLQSLADMDITFTALKETDIGRHVNRLRKDPSNEVRKLVKQLVRKWKEIVDEWVRLNPQGEHASSGLMDGDSPQQKIPRNGHHQVPDFAYSPNPHNGSSGSDKNNSEPERKAKPVPLRKEAPTKPTQYSVPVPAPPHHNVQRQREQQRERNFDAERLASASKRLQANYKEAENAKKQRTIQVMDIHEIPKRKNAFFAKNKGGGGSQGRHW